ncbi:separase [Volvox carteri f. nagariensis]|uniref:separase n=1 Tax=Volvox carteri f. nagariensis TaxID=3068 RepID=D8U9W0_VOLCA|nr:separase [Volvox carteri f. nagariensis]EFJ43479.1 separase [Volvox carteri f. nagariensis]|eukprot:XP_002955408.1 separase [Volvox carteri f. nagariensis]
MADAQASLTILAEELDIEKLKLALLDINVLLEPLLDLGRVGKVNAEALRPVARSHGSVVTSLLKSMGCRLSPDSKHSHDLMLVFGDAASLGLNALDCLRPVIKTSQHELDIQRYNFVRKLAGHGLHEHAMVQGKVLLASAATSPGTITGPSDLHIAAVANLLVCYSALVKQGASRAEALWRDIHGPVDSLLSLAREAVDTHEAANRLDVVLKCLSKVVETLQYACVARNLSPAAVAQQLSALTSCGALCRQEQAVQQMLVDDAAAAPDTVKLVMTEALLHLITSDGSLSEHLVPVIHQLILRLGQKRTGPAPPVDYRLDLLEDGDSADADVAVPSGTSAVTTAVRLLVAHALCTGQLSALREDMSRYVELLKRLLTSPKHRYRHGGSASVEPALLHSLSASLGNAGLDLLQAQHAAPAAVLLQAAADLALERVRQLRALRSLVPETDILQLIKKCKAHVMALQQLSLHEDAMAASGACVAHLHMPSQGDVSPASTSDAVIGRLIAVTKTGTAVPRALVQFLAAAAIRERGGRSGLLNALDMYAVQELEVVRDESKRREEDSLQSLYSNAVLGALHACSSAAGSSQIPHARELLVKAVISNATLEAQTCDLRFCCELLDAHAVQISKTGVLPAAELGLLDSAALAHAQLGLCLAQSQMSGRSCLADTDAVDHMNRAISLWNQLLEACGRSGAGLLLRMPQATLHAALQVQQFVHLRNGKMASYSGEIIWRLMSNLDSQVKLREQHIYLLSSTMPFTSCTAWTFTAQPTAPLAEAFEDMQQHRKLADVLKMTEPVRNIYASGATDHVAAAAIAESCAMELEHSGFLRHGSASLLLRSQCCQLAAAAYLRAGKTASAYVQAQEALRITCSLFILLDCPALPYQNAAARGSGPATSTATDQCDMTPAEAAAAAIKSGATTTVLDYAAEDYPSNAKQQANDDAVLFASSNTGNGALEMRSSRGFSIGLAWAVAAAHLASLHNAARVFEAAGCAEDAICLWKECSRTAELFGANGVQLLCSGYLAELSCRRGDAETAAAQVETADVAMSMYDVHVAKSDLHAADAALLTAHVCSARARLALLHQCHDQVNDASHKGTAACCIAVAAAQQDLASACQQGCTKTAPMRRDVLAWHGICLRAQLDRMRAEALLQDGRRQEAAQLLDSALVQLQQAATTSSSRSAAEVWPVAYGLLLAHRATATSPAALLASDSASVVGLGLGHNGPNSCLAKHGLDQTSSSDTSDTTDRLSGADQSIKRGGKPNASSGSSKSLPKRQPRLQDARQADGATSFDDAGAVCWSVPALLQSLQLCWQLPLAAVYACRQLLNAAIALGLPYAATMFLHLGQGMSYAQEQALQQESRRFASQIVRQLPDATDLDICTQRNPQDNGDMEANGIACSSGQSEFILTAGIREVAMSMLSEIHLKNASITDTLLYLENCAETWVHRALSILPPDVVVSCITQDTQGGQLLVGRLTHGGAPLLAVLPGARAGVSGRQPTECSAAGRLPSHVLDRCVARLHQLLEESGDSMHMDQDAASSQSHKVKWWKTRVSLDEGVRGLLQELDEQCLGPWRCLLLSVPNAHLEVWRAAADAFIAEHFPSVHSSGEGHCGSPAAVLRELVIIALSSMRHMKGGDLAALLGIICNQLGLHGGQSLTTGLVMEFAAAEAAARVQLLKLPPDEQSSGSMPFSTNESRCEQPSPGSGPTVPRGRIGTAPTTRTRPGAAFESLHNTTAAHRLGLSRRPGSSSGGSESVDTDNAPPQPDQPSECSKVDTAHGIARTPSTTEPSSGTPQGSKSELAGTVQPAAGPVLLVLSPALHALPWESIPCCHGKELYRILSLQVACATASARTEMQHVNISSDLDGRVAALRHCGSRGMTVAGTSGSATSVFYVLNPSSDLVESQQFLQPILEAQAHWKGITGERPSTQALLTALQSHELFLYFGHGSGEQYLPLPALRKLQRCASCMLMGCSSGRLRLHGAYDPSGAAVAYLLAGCPALVANLWDVTDRDIDRYAQALMHSWLGCTASTPSASTGSKCGMAGGAKRERPCSDVGPSEPLGLAVTRSRSACKLTHLIGAAPVCYGLPFGR